MIGIIGAMAPEMAILGGRLEAAHETRALRRGGANRANLATAILWGHEPAMWITAVSSLLAELIVQRKPWIRAAFNAAQIVASGKPGDDDWHELVADFDFWLRSDGHRRNPGTTADLITAGLFVTLWEGTLRPPLDQR